ncbi:MAG: hypothetical protein ACFFHV_05415 [Promethearchaeota archaeon]
MTIIAPEKPLTNGIDFEVKINEEGTIVDALSEIDKKIYENPEKSIFPLYKGLIHSYLQLIWNPEKNKIYEDCAVNAYGPNREFMPIMENADVKLYPDSNITLSVHAD